jgi:2-oxopent-4-enoate/cis-2-oxohex-4-enoate hydratase
MTELENGGPPALDPGDHRRLARVLLAAARERRPVEPLGACYPQLNVADARRIRDSALADRLAEGERLAGAVASPGRAGEPRLAWLTSEMVLSNARVPLADLIDPHVEPRLALQLVQPLADPVGSVAALVRASQGLRLCLEVVDSRYAPGPSTPADEIADNCGTAKVFIAGETAAPGADALADGAIDALVMLAACVAHRQGGLEPGTLLVAPLHGSSGH